MAGRGGRGAVLEGDAVVCRDGGAGEEGGRA